MLTLLFTIVFIAELIIASWIISKIQKLNRVVCEANTKVLEAQVELKTQITETRLGITKALTALKKFTNFVDDTKDEYSNLVEKNIFSTVLSIILKLPYKKIMSALEVGLMIKKLLK